MGYGLKFTLKEIINCVSDVTVFVDVVCMYVCVYVSVSVTFLNYFINHFSLVISSTDQGKYRVL